jgi:hypothetical protein
MRNNYLGIGDETWLAVEKRRGEEGCLVVMRLE